MTIKEISSSGIVSGQSEKISSELSEFSLLHEGGYCVLYKAKRYGKWYVVKCLKEEFVGNGLYEDLLKKEFGIGILMDHQNIARTLSFEHNDSLGNFLVIEYIDGENLSSFLHKDIGDDIKKKIALEILSAMSYWHSLQVVHRDLKPSNILITRNGSNVKVIDFGLSDSDCHAALKQSAGTKAYMAPEQKSGASAIDARADIYSFGLVLREIFPHKYSGIAGRCCSLNRDDRYSSAAKVIEAISAVDRRVSFLIGAVSAFIAVACVAFLFYVVVGNSKSALGFFDNDTVVVKELVKDTSSARMAQVDDLSASPLPAVKDTVVIHETDTVRISDYTPEQKKEVEDLMRFIDRKYDAFIADVKNGKFVYREDANYESFKLMYEVLAEINSRSGSYGASSMFRQQFVMSTSIYHGEVSKKANSVVKSIKLSYKSAYDSGLIAFEEYDTLCKMYNKRMLGLSEK